MKRPVITEFMGDGFTLNKAHKQYLENLELWRYLQALDAYCDELEMEESERLFEFFIWFRENGEKHLDKSIEKMIQIYLKQ